ncbi:hypothetical protein BDEG_24382 [Batrachochytrium dendrobatidis JEL423]|uniref:PH domain-containing protein n=2 Tax=Batrachochytrium dendrobatidis TaxID=109871 RepID=A0A177WLW2_BATDL|nr:hypothetical protein BDEG_24382 [Batrachochytrium dendrobatidis JEL423]
MQEVTIKPRDIFKHTVVVDEPFKELCWNFCTRRKNISFGLFRIIRKPVAGEPAKLVLVSGSMNELGRNYTTNQDGALALNNSPLPSPRLDKSIGIHSPIKDLAGNVDTSHVLNSTVPGVSHTKTVHGRRTTVSTGSCHPPTSIRSNTSPTFALHPQTISPNPSTASITTSLPAAGLAFASADVSTHPHIHHAYNPTNSANLPLQHTTVSMGDLSASTTPPMLHHSGKDGSLSSLRSIDNAVSGTNKKQQRPRLDDPDLEEVIQIAHYESSKATIKGNYYIQEPGTYILVFDNRFSVNTSKKLFFFVALMDVEPTAMVIKKEVEGWMLKKGNRKMQGFQRRWVEVDSSGSLIYYKSPGNPSRGSVSLSTAAIRLDHDSGQSTYHFKVETLQEFERWTGCIEKFAASRSMQLVDENCSFLNDNLNLVSNLNSSPAQSSQITDPELDIIHHQVSTVLVTLKQELVRMNDLADTFKSRIDSKTHSKELVHILNNISDTTSRLITTSATTSSQLHAFHTRIQGQRERSGTMIQQAESAFYACLNDNNCVRKRFGLEPVTTATFLPNGVFMSTYHERMGSVTSTFKDDEFFDAQEGSEDSYRTDSEDSLQYREAEQHGRYESDIIKSSSGGVSMLKLSTSVEDARLAMSSMELTPKLTEPALNKMHTVQNLANSATQVIKRRVKLPAPACSMQNVSILSILRNNVGKDLSTVTMPIVLNEPISLLQKLCEELEYSDLLDTAAHTTDPVDRLCYIAGFVVSGYSSTVYRAARKPFNPLLGETFEFIRPDKGFKFVSEKVSHHPPVMACYAESKNYRIFQDSLLKTKFWGKSMELNNTGTVHLEFPALNEEYVWSKVTTSMRNLFAPSRYLEHHGIMKISSLTTGYCCELTFKESGYFTSANNEVVGAVFNPRGQKVISLCGKWDHSFNKFLDSAPDKLQVIWRASPFPSDQADNYGFTQFAVELNEITPDIVNMLPSTDVRYRPDQRMYEEGKAEQAEEEKLRLEQKQRETRKAMEASGKQWTPQWFELQPDEHSEGGRAWRYKGGYFEQRGKFPHTIDLFT